MDRSNDWASPEETLTRHSDIKRFQIDDYPYSSEEPHNNYGFSRSILGASLRRFDAATGFFEDEKKSHPYLSSYNPEEDIIDSWYSVIIGEIYPAVEFDEFIGNDDIKHYELVDDETLKVFTRFGVHKYCIDNRVSPVDFNMNVIIDDDMLFTNTDGMFAGCMRFDKHVEIPDRIESTYRMFEYCLSLKAIYNLPDNLRCAELMFHSCPNLNDIIICGGREYLSPDIIEFYYSEMIMLVGEKSEFFDEINTTSDGQILCKKHITIDAEACSEMFADCTKLNLNIKLGSNVKSCCGMLWGCTSFNSCVAIDKTLVRKDSRLKGFALDDMFMDCTSLNKPVHIPKKTTSCKGTFARCTSLTGLISVPDTVESVDRVFAGCESMHEYIVLFTQESKPADTVADDEFREVVADDVPRNSNVQVTFYNYDSKAGPEMSINNGAVGVYIPEDYHQNYIIEMAKHLDMNKDIYEFRDHERYKKAVLDVLYDYANNNGDSEYAIEYLEFVSDKNSGKTTEDIVKETLSLDDNNTGETSLFG